MNTALTVQKKPDWGLLDRSTSSKVGHYLSV